MPRLNNELKNAYHQTALIAPPTAMRQSIRCYVGPFILEQYPEY